MSNSKKEYKILKEVTDSTLTEVMKYDVVLPSLYKDVFAEKIQRFDMEFTDNLDLATEMASKKLNNFEERVSDNAFRLQEEVSKATEAIETMDTKALRLVQEEMSRLQNEISEIRGKLFVDELTRLYNRKWLFERYAREGHFQTDGVMVFCDLDEFKKINDSHGHIVGDKVLAFFGRAIAHENKGLAVRYAGDEFIVIYEGEGMEEAVQHMERVSASLNKKLFKVGEETSFKLRFSYGTEPFAKGDELITVVEHADQRMYDNKRRTKS